MKPIQILYSIYAIVPVGVCLFGFPIILLSRTFGPVANIYYWFIFVVSDFLMLSRESKDVREELLTHLMKKQMEESGFKPKEQGKNNFSDENNNHLNPGVTVSDEGFPKHPELVPASYVLEIEKEPKASSSLTKSDGIVPNETNSAIQTDKNSSEINIITSFKNTKCHQNTDDVNLDVDSNAKVFKVLEIGPGTGTNLAFYPPGVNLSLIELNPLLHKQINYIRKKHPHITIDQVILGNAEDMLSIGIADESFDAIVGTHILCCIKNVPAALKEINRILKPGGKFYTCEFVSYSEDLKSPKKWIQKMYAPFWYFFSLGCKAGNQNVINLLKEHSFDTNSLIETIHPTLPVTHAVTLYGSAVKV